MVTGSNPVVATWIFRINRAGLSLRRIAAMLGVSVGTAHNYVNGYPCKATPAQGIWRHVNRSGVTCEHYQQGG